MRIWQNINQMKLHINPQNDVNYVNHVLGKLIDSFKNEKDTCYSLTQDLQGDFDFIDGVDVPIKLTERKADNYFIENPMTYVYQVDLKSIDKYEIVELQDVHGKVELQDIPIAVINEQEIEACTQEEEVVGDMALPEVYRVDTEIHTGIQLETPMIKSEEKCVTPSEPKLVQDMALFHDTPTPPQTIAQSMTEQKISLPGRVLQAKLIPITHASQRETLRSVRKEIPTYTDSICRHLSKLLGKQNSLEGEIGKKIAPYINPVYRHHPKPPNIQNTEGERIWVFEQES